jgi:hypothetical protein
MLRATGQRWSLDSARLGVDACDKVGRGAARIDEVLMELRGVFFSISPEGSPFNGERAAADPEREREGRPLPPPLRIGSWFLLGDAIIKIYFVESLFIKSDSR